MAFSCCYLLRKKRKLQLLSWIILGINQLLPGKKVKLRRKEKEKVTTREGDAERIDGPVTGAGGTGSRLPFRLIQLYIDCFAQPSLPAQVVAC
jgi:hypothetical protein